MRTRILAGHLKVRDGQVLWADEDAHGLLGYPRGALCDLPFGDVLAPRPDANPEAADMAVPARGAIDIHRASLLVQDGRSILVDLRGERMDDGSILWTFGLAARGVRGERLDMLSRHDALTRLPNRLPSLEELSPPFPAHELAAERMLAVCYLDIDQFRNVNDRFGPVGGDTVLREVARRLKGALPHEAVAARVGGDEF